jgi:hypothetical protein
MKFNAWALVAQILAVVPEIMAVAAGQTETLPAIHVHSGTTNVEITIIVSQDAKK